MGLVTNLARPGGNLTGFSLMAADIGGKRLELLAGDGSGPLSRCDFLERVQSLCHGTGVWTRASTATPPWACHDLIHLTNPVVQPRMLL